MPIKIFFIYQWFVLNKHCCSFFKLWLNHIIWKAFYFIIKSIIWSISFTNKLMIKPGKCCIVTHFLHVVYKKTSSPWNFPCSDVYFFFFEEFHNKFFCWVFLIFWKKTANCISWMIIKEFWADKSPKIILQYHEVYFIHSCLCCYLLWFI